MQILNLEALLEDVRCMRRVEYISDRRIIECIYSIRSLGWMESRSHDIGAEVKMHSFDSALLHFFK